MWSSLAVVAILLAEASAVTTMPPSDSTCSLEEMENPLIKCACVQKGYGSPEDRAQCLGHESGEEFRLQRVKRWDQVCEPGTSFMSDCNTCKCNTQGNEAVCTQKICYKRCRPGTLRFVDCNACLCHQNNWKCTKKDCSQYQHVEGDTSTYQEFSCIPGTTYMDKCNTCWCRPDGKSGSCTDMDCPPGSYPGGAAAATQNYISCTPSTTYKDKCNTCWCGPDGKPGFCTLMNCPPGSY